MFFFAHISRWWKITRDQSEEVNVNEKGDEEGKYIFRILNWNLSSLYTCTFVRLKVEVINWVNILINCVTIGGRFWTTCLTNVWLTLLFQASRYHCLDEWLNYIICKINERTNFGLRKLVASVIFSKWKN